MYVDCKKDGVRVQFDIDRNLVGLESDDPKYILLPYNGVVPTIGVFERARIYVFACRDCGVAMAFLAEREDRRLDYYNVEYSAEDLLWLILNFREKEYPAEG